jgi:hypothetical protein
MITGEEELKLMALMMQAGVGFEYIKVVLLNCEKGMKIGHAMKVASDEWSKKDE